MIALAVGLLKSADLRFIFGAYTARRGLGWKLALLLRLIIKDLTGSLSFRRGSSTLVMI